MVEDWVIARPDQRGVNQLARRHNGAIEVDAATTKPLVVFLAGPIKHWWSLPDWDEELPARYFEWRDAVEVAFIEAGFLVYMPHSAFRGSWWEAAQEINDFAISRSDILVYLTPDGVPADGTEHEVATAERFDRPTMHLPPGSVEDLAAAVHVLRFGHDRTIMGE